MSNPGSREIYEQAALVAGALTSAPASFGKAAGQRLIPFPHSPIFRLVYQRSGRLTAGEKIAWHPASETPGPDSVRLVPGNRFQDILGFGGCFSDAACFQISQLGKTAEEFLHDLFHPSEMNLSVNRTCMARPDSATES